MGLRDFIRRILNSPPPEPINAPTFGLIFDNQGSWFNDQFEIPGYDGRVEISVPGDKDGPTDASRELFREIIARLPELNAQSERKLFQFYAAYFDRDATLTSAAEIWSIADLTRINLCYIPGSLATEEPYDFELGYGMDWDPEHTYAAFFKDWRLLHCHPDG